MERGGGGKKFGVRYLHTIRDDDDDDDDDGWTKKVLLALTSVGVRGAKPIGKSHRRARAGTRPHSQ